MEIKVEKFYREQIKLGLCELPSGWSDKFDRMYGSVDSISIDRLDSALAVVERSLLSVNSK